MRARPSLRPPIRRRVRARHLAGPPALQNVVTRAVPLRPRDPSRADARNSGRNRSRRNAQACPCNPTIHDHALLKSSLRQRSGARRRHPQEAEGIDATANPRRPRLTSRRTLHASSRSCSSEIPLPPLQPRLPGPARLHDVRPGGVSPHSPPFMPLPPEAADAHAPATTRNLCPRNVSRSAAHGGPCGGGAEGSHAPRYAPSRPQACSRPRWGRCTASMRGP